MIEPYQPGKIPVVFVDGLMSDPFTWANIANELRAGPVVSPAALVSLHSLGDMIDGELGNK